MLQPTLTHYAPHDEDAARCGARLPEAAHSLTPTCSACAASLAADDAPLPTDADAYYAGVAESILTTAVAVTRAYARPTPLGHTRCAACATLSPLYEPFPSCADCAEPICPACDVPQQRTEDERGATQCRACAASAAVAS